MTPSIPLKAKVEAVLQASKWQKIPVLIDVDEMQSLFAFLGEFWMVQISGLIPFGREKISQDEFLEVYENYILALKNGKILVDARMRSCFSSVWTLFLDALYAVKVNETQCLVKVIKPVVQLQSHRCDYSHADETFRSMVLGMDSISWGLQFSFPQIYQNEHMEILTVKGEEFLNTVLFKKIQQWIRGNTVATPFEVEGKKMNVPIRLGKKCFEWINSHPQLKAKNIRVSVLGKKEKMD